MSLYDIIENIRPLHAESMVQCRNRWNSLAKPLYGLGRIEDAVIQIAGIRETPDVMLDKKALVVLCADNGVVGEGVTQTGQEVTAIVAENFLRGRTTACIMAERAGADVFPVDIGMVRDTGVPKKKIAYGTGNIARGPAMTREEALEAIQTGIEIVEELKSRGYDIIATGEMGIGNTTTSSAVASVLLCTEPEQMTGRGAGLDNEGLDRKKRIIRQAIERNCPDPEDPVDVLAKVGGYDLAGLTGIFLGGALHRVPVVMDGFISGTAALAAERLDSKVSGYIIPSHVSEEPASMRVMRALGKEPFIDCGMNLGEGTGAVALYPLLDMGMDVYHKMSTFEETNIEPYESDKTSDENR